MGNCFKKQDKSPYNPIEEDRTAGEREQGHHDSDVVIQERGHHHPVKEEEVVITIGQGTHIHSKVVPDDLLGLSQYPFLCEEDTINFIHNSHTVFIMRGVPGSGKSTLAKRIQKEYPKAVKCSADDFFIDTDGIYRYKEDSYLDTKKYDHTKISKAHQTCQEKAQETMENGVSVLIIDNTNINRWEMAPYLKLAQSSYYYHVILVEPNTPWKDSVEGLHSKTQHGVPADKIRQMLTNLKSQQLQPLYYGWFLTKSDSSDLFQLGIKCLMEGVVVVGADLTNCSNPADILNSLQSKYLKPHLMLHCTAKFLGSNPKNEYHHRDLVKKSMHRIFKIKVTGISFTETNIGAKLELDSEQLKLFESEYEAERKRTRDESSDREGNRTADEELVELEHGCSAHITLTFAHDSSARITGKDMLEIMSRRHTDTPPRIRRKTTSGQFSAWEDGYYFFELTESVCYTTLFHGHYPRR